MGPLMNGEKTSWWILWKKMKYPMPVLPCPSQAISNPRALCVPSWFEEWWCSQTDKRLILCQLYMMASLTSVPGKIMILDLKSTCKHIKHEKAISNSVDLLKGY